MRRKILAFVIVLTMVFTGVALPQRTPARENADTQNTELSKKKVVSLVEKAMEIEEYVEGELLVVLKQEYSSRQAVFKAGDFPEVNATKVENLTYCNNPDSELISEDFRTVLSIKLKYKTDKEMLEAVDILMDRDDVESVSLNEEASAEAVQTVPTSDSQFENQWALKKIDAMGAWSKTTGSAEVKVGIMDSGIDYTHEELAPNMWKNPGEIPGDGIDNDHNGYIDDVYGYDFYENDSDPMDTFHHGTFCAGIVAADINHNDVVGIAPNVKLVALRVGDTRFYSSAKVKAMTYAANMGIDVINYSGKAASRSTAEDAVLHNYGGIFVVAAANDSSDNDITPTYPRTNEFTNVVKVASTTSSDALSSFSNFGAVDVTLAAPGSSVMSTTLNNTYAFGDGTSYAAPYVAGVVALIKSQYPNLTRAQVMDSVKKGVDKLDSLNGKVATGGRLNANKAMEEARFKSMSAFVGRSMDVYTYADLKEAMENNNYATAFIRNDIELEGEIKLTKSKRIFGGAKLNGNGKRHFIIDTNESVLLDLGGVIYKNGGIENRSLDLKLQGSGAVITNSSASKGGAIYNIGEMKVNSVRIENCSATSGGGIYNSGLMTLTDTTVYGNNASAGGGIYTTGPVTITEGIIKNNTSKGKGGGIYGGSDSLIVVKERPQIFSNTAVFAGGGIYTSGQLRSDTSGIWVNKNEAQYGAGLYADTGANINLVGTPGAQDAKYATFDANKASVDGAGIYLNTGASLYLQNAIFAVNKAQGAGGAMLAKGDYTCGNYVIYVSNNPNDIVYQ